MSAFDKVIGYDYVKRELCQISDMIKNFGKYERLGAKMPHGVIIHGVPGVGKTLLATAFIEEISAPHIIIRHDTAKDSFCDRIKEIFSEMGERDEQTVILLDDLDKFSLEEKNGDVFAVVQSCIDSVKDKKVFVIATANEIRNLPGSLVRSGRFDRVIKVNHPEGEDAVKIIAHYMDGVKVADDINHEDIAKMLTGRSCATLETVINTAAIEAAYSDKDSIGMDEFVKATLNDVYGLENRCGEMSLDEREMIAYHEAGHAIIAELLNPGYIGMLSLSSSRNSGMGGFALPCKHHKRRPHEVLTALGGKAACEMKYGRVASGTGKDLDDAYEDVSCGIGTVGNMGMSFLDSSYKGDSQTLRARREEVIAAELERYLFKAKEMIAENREFLEKVTAELLQKQTLLYSDMKRIRESCTLTAVEVG